MTTTPPLRCPDCLDLDGSPARHERCAWEPCCCACRGGAA